MDRKALYAAFSGALDLLRRIDEDAKSFFSKLPKIYYLDSKLDCSFPYISALPKYDGSDEELHFRILRPHPDIQSYRLLYIAETLDEKQIMVKFTRQYPMHCMHFVPNVVMHQSFAGSRHSQEVGLSLPWTTFRQFRHLCIRPNRQTLPVSSISG
jgi:hypothetical protein